MVLLVRLRYYAVTLMAWWSTLTREMRVEGAEMLSLASSSGWWISLLYDSHFMSTSPYLLNIVSVIDSKVCMATSLILAVANIAGLTGSAFAHNYDAKMFSMFFRRGSLVVAAFCWGILCLLLIPHGRPTPGFFLYGYMTCTCIWGVYRLTLMIATEEKLTVKRVTAKRGESTGLPVTEARG